jgi:hypothetical protein
MVGVTLDVLLLPSAVQLAAGEDPVLEKAAQLGGVNLDAVEAGKLCPFEWAAPMSHRYTFCLAHQKRH